jgi:hypothetical protein
MFVPIPIDLEWWLENPILPYQCLAADLLVNVVAVVVFTVFIACNATWKYFRTSSGVLSFC